jgi:hypothetical protein
LQEVSTAPGFNLTRRGSIDTGVSPSFHPRRNTSKYSFNRLRKLSFFDFVFDNVEKGQDTVP